MTKSVLRSCIVLLFVAPSFRGLSSNGGVVVVVVEAAFHQTTGLLLSLPMPRIPTSPFRNNKKVFVVQSGAAYASPRGRRPTMPRVINLSKSNHNDGDDNDDIDDTHQHPSFQKYLELNDRRRAVRRTPIFANLDPVDVERLIQVMEDKIYVKEGETLFRMGDVIDGMYFVAQGSFRGIDENEQNVRVCEKLDVIGEIPMLLMDAPRALFAFQASSPDAAVWKLSQDNFQRIMTGSTRDNAITVLNAGNDAIYAEFLNKKARRDALIKCPVFKSLVNDDLERVIKAMRRVDIPAGSVAFRQGDEAEDDATMYFVTAGQVELYKEASAGGERIIKTCGPGDFFGELVLFFAKARVVSARAKTDSSAWVLSKEDYNQAVQESKVRDDAVALLAQEYNEKTIWNCLPKLSPDEIWDLLVLNSRPTKKQVSLHSSLSILAIGTFIAADFPLLAIGMDPNIHMPRILDVNGANNAITLHQMQLSGWLLAATAFMGLFRLPPNTPPARRVWFQIVASTCVAIALVTSSNLTGANEWVIDGFVFPWNFVLPGAAIVNFGSYLLGLDDAITGTNKGRDSLPNAETRTKAAVLYSCFAFVNIFLVQIALAGLFSDRATFDQVVVPFIQDGGLVGSRLTAFVGVSAYISLAAFVSTLRFEKKIEAGPAQIAMVLLTVFFMFDAVTIAIVAIRDPDAFSALSKAGAQYYQDLANTFHPFSVGIAAVAATALNAFRKVVMNEKTGDDNIPAGKKKMKALV